jgi:hypothetical protein
MVLVVAGRMKCEHEALVECSDREKLKYWSRNLWVLVALSPEDKQSQLKTDHLSPSSWEVKVVWSCVELPRIPMFLCGMLFQ